MFLYWQLFGGLRMSGGYYQFQAPQLRVIPILRTAPEQQPFVDDVTELQRILEGPTPGGRQAEEIRRRKRFCDAFGLDENDRMVIRGMTVAE